MIADLSFEDRLLDRLALNEAARRWLNPRRRRILRCRGEGWTLREIAAREGVSVERIRQEELKSFVILRKPQAGLGTELWTPPKPAIITTPSGFDRAAFISHMRFLIARKRQAAMAAAEAEALREAGEREAEFAVLRGVVRDQEERERALEREAREHAAWQERMRREEEERQERIRVLNGLERLDEQVRQHREQEDARWAAALQGLMEEMGRHEGEMTAQQRQKYQWLQLLRHVYGTEMAARYVGFPTIAAALMAGRGGNAS